MRNCIILILGITLLYACGKNEGEGGKNTISGVIMKQEFTETTNQFITQYASPEERVYIIYGDNAYYADEYRTNFDGSYRFEYLYKGNYQLFVYSECLACPGGLEPLFIEVELAERKENFEVDTIFVKKFIN